MNNAESKNILGTIEIANFIRVLCKYYNIYHIFLLTLQHILHDNAISFL